MSRLSSFVRRMRAQASRPSVHTPAGAGGRGVTLCHVNGLSMRLDTREMIQHAMAGGIYEPEQTRWFRECLKPGDRVVDIGANAGYYAGLASTLVGRSGEVFAFEPSPVAAAIIEDTIRRNRLRNLRLVKAAVGDVSGTVQLYMPSSGGVHSPSALESDPTFLPLEVPVLPLDDYEPLKDGRPIDLIKIDVEGFEPNVVRGMRNLAQARRVRNVMCEFNSGWLRRNCARPETLLVEILALGFCIHKQTELATYPEADGRQTFSLR